MRIRTIKPEFWQSEDLSQVSDKAKLLAIGLLNMADDEGYLKAHPAIIKSQLFPFNTGSLNIQGILTELSNVDYIDILTGDDGKQYVHIKNFLKHQKVNRPSPSKIKGSVEFIDNSLSGQGGFTIGKEQGTGKGKEQGKEDMSTKADDSLLIFEYWKEVMKKNNQSIFNDKRKLAVKARLKEGYTADQIKQAILGCSMTPHNMGKNDNGKLYDDLELICRNGSNLERFMNNSQVVQQPIQQMSEATRQTLEAIERGAPAYEPKRLG